MALEPRVLEGTIRRFVRGKDLSVVTARQVKAYVREELKDVLADEEVWEQTVKQIRPILQKVVNEAAETQSEQQKPAQNESQAALEGVLKSTGANADASSAGNEDAAQNEQEDAQDDNGSDDDGEGEQDAQDDDNDEGVSFKDSDSEEEKVSRKSATSKAARGAKGPGEENSDFEERPAPKATRRRRKNDSDTDGDPGEQDDKIPVKRRRREADRDAGRTRKKPQKSKVSADDLSKDEKRLKRLMQRSRELGIGVPFTRFRGKAAAEKFDILEQYLHEKGISSPLSMTPQAVSRHKERLETQKDLEGIELDNIIDQPRRRRASAQRYMDQLDKAEAENEGGSEDESGDADDNGDGKPNANGADGDQASEDDEDADAEVEAEHSEDDGSSDFDPDDVDIDAPVVFVRSRCRPRQQICHICNELGAQVPTRAQSRVYEKIQFICELPLEHAQGVIFDRRKFLQEHLICLCELVSKAVHPLLSKHSELLKPLRYALPVLIGKSRVQAPVQLVNDRRYAYLLVRLPAVFKQALLELFDTPLYAAAFLSSVVCLSSFCKLEIVDSTAVDRTTSKESRTHAPKSTDRHIISAPLFPAKKPYFET
eukprot:CAMPEP_0198723314 /NCGR_PEP_ID=MMETSP1475-20131203/838_1 /TAXON_ID= ORGANISM="Unidentified sp., Strain CCMP1999" /NCGR_SAMPLE_ID=MMETSP1475 /ASSEMBLY_ACC=CAM_ASM_001111 /LENGTH=597 /DNA_ID=CAMNT_0044484399 /DNA_START=80 /DNA_END=1871 /DNA_ORIENTATION=+